MKIIIGVLLVFIALETYVLMDVIRADHFHSEMACKYIELYYERCKLG